MLSRPRRRRQPLPLLHQPRRSLNQRRKQSLKRSKLLLQQPQPRTMARRSLRTRLWLLYRNNKKSLPGGASRKNDVPQKKLLQRPRDNV